jgi:hypothetical protein
VAFAGMEGAVVGEEDADGSEPTAAAMVDGEQGGGGLLAVGAKILGLVGESQRDREVEKVRVF